MSNPEQEKLHEIVTRIQDGDKKAECELIDKYYKTLFFIILKQTDDHYLAQEVCQETFIIVLQKTRKGEIKNSYAMGSFIRSTGVNLIIEHKRKVKRQKTDLTESFEHLSDAQVNTFVSQLERKKAVELVTQVLQELKNDRDRTLLSEYFVYGKSKQEICTDLELSAEHFDKVLYRARQRLKQLLSIQLNIDTSDVITHLMSFALVCVFAGSYIGTKVSRPYELRDFLSSYHYSQNGPQFFIDGLSDSENQVARRNVV